MIIDTHCHLYLPEFKEDVDNMLKRAVDAGIKQFFLPAIDGSTHNEMMEMEKNIPENVFP